MCMLRSCSTNSSSSYLVINNSINNFNRSVSKQQPGADQHVIFQSDMLSSNKRLAILSTYLRWRFMIQQELMLREARRQHLPPDGTKTATLIARLMETQRLCFIAEVELTGVIITLIFRLIWADCSMFAESLYTIATIHSKIDSAMPI